MTSRLSPLLLIALFLQLLPWASLPSHAALKWISTLQTQPSTSERVELKSTQHRFYLAKTKWSCAISSVKTSTSPSPSETRSIQCTNLRDRDVVEVPLVCFDQSEHLGLTSLQLKDDEQRVFQISLACEHRG